MADIFISYAREDRPRIEILAAALSSKGWSVWWDRDLPIGGKPFGTIIEEELYQARCVIVAWSQHSTNSHWVLDEASYARDKGVLAPTLFEKVIPPLGFRQFNAVDLSNWDHGEDHQELRRLYSHIDRIIGLKRKDEQRPEGHITAHNLMATEFVDPHDAVDTTTTTIVSKDASRILKIFKKIKFGVVKTRLFLKSFVETIAVIYAACVRFVTHRTFIIFLECLVLLPILVFLASVATFGFVIAVSALAYFFDAELTFLPNKIIIYVHAIAFFAFSLLVIGFFAEELFAEESKPDIGHAIGLSLFLGIAFLIVDAFSGVFQEAPVDALILYGVVVSLSPIAAYTVLRYW